MKKDEKEKKEEKVVKETKTKAKKTTTKTTKKEEGKKQLKEKEEKSSPVIIRREVIVNDDDEKLEKERAKKEQTRKSVGFVERNTEANYNIVYRNKPTKPMSVSELFGFAKKKTETTLDAKTETKKADSVKEKKEEKATDKKEEKTIKKEKTDLSGFRRNPNFNRNANDSYRDKSLNKDKNQQEGKGTSNKQSSTSNKNQKNSNDNRKYSKDITPSIEPEFIEKVKKNNHNIDREKNERREDSQKNLNRNNKRSERFVAKEYDEGKIKDLKQLNNLSSMFEDNGGMLDYYDLTTARGKRNRRKATKKTGERTQKIFALEQIEIPESITVKDLSTELKKTSSEVIKKLLGYGVMATINNEIDFDTASLIADEFGVKAIKKTVINEEDILFDESEDKEEELQERPPVVVVMGHVDHGKTKLLDAIRKTNVIEGEAGGITQRIGAYMVKVKDREITFLDTPGHEAFASMRARGAHITDIAILVVAANDGVMPQTIEAINHAKDANLPIIVAINKVDLPESNVEKVKQELMKYELVPEEWGGNTIMVPISAKEGTGIDELLEMVLLQADMLELKTNPNKQAKGVVIEAKLDPSKGPMASLLVQRGKLSISDTIVVGETIGRIRAMRNDKGIKVKDATASMPVVITGLTEVPSAGDTFYEVKDEKMAKHLIERRKRTAREKSINKVPHITMDNMYEQLEQGKLKKLNIIVKADVQGSAEALKQSLEKLSDDKVIVSVINAVAGAVNESDVNLANISNALIIAFNVRPIAGASDLAKRNEVEIKQYSVIYNAIDDVKLAMDGLLDPVYEEHLVGNAEVRQTFKISNVGTIAGCYVTNGKLERNAGIRVIRDNVVIHEGKLLSLKRFKDDAKEVEEGYECGMQVKDYNDIQTGDIIECYEQVEIGRA